MSKINNQNIPKRCTNILLINTIKSCIKNVIERRFYHIALLIKCLNSQKRRSNPNTCKFRLEIYDFSNTGYHNTNYYQRSTSTEFMVFHSVISYN